MPLALAVAMVAAPAAGLVEMEVPMCLGVVLICIACVCVRGCQLHIYLSWDRGIWEHPPNPI